MSLYLPSIDSYTIIDPELFVDELPEEAELEPDADCEKGCHHTEVRKRKPVREPFLEPIAEREYVGAEFSSLDEDHKNDLDLKSSFSESGEFSSATDRLPPLSSAKWVGWNDVVRDDKHHRARDGRRRVRQCRSMHDVVSIVTSRREIDGGVFGDHVTVRHTPGEVNNF